ncbi:MAG: PPC domain-containing protein, partial [Planctomycetaceae bacterium]|nr:PPC domain-containing protein [Planctomycetaceae bacterium]
MTTRFFRLILSGLTVISVTMSVTRAQLPATRLDGLYPAGTSAGSTVTVTIHGTDLDDVSKLLFSHAGITATPVMTEPTVFDPEPLPVTNQFLITAAADVPPGQYEVRANGRFGLSNPRSFIVSQAREVVETEPNNDAAEATVVEIPAVVNGQASGSADVDWYRFSGTAGQRLLVKGFGRQIDSLIELSLSVSTPSGQVLAESPIGNPGTPLLDFRLPADGEYLLKVHDALFRQGDGYHYRIELGSLPHLEYIDPPAVAAGQTAEVTVFGHNLPGGQLTDLTVDGVRLESVTTQVTMPPDIVGSLRYTGRVEPHQAFLDGIEFRMQSEGRSSNPLLIPAAPAALTPEAANDDPLAPQQLTLPAGIAGQFYPVRDVDWYQFEATKDDVWVIDVCSQRLGLPTDPAIMLQRVVPPADGADSQEPTYRDVIFLDDVQVRNVNNRSGQHEFDESTSDPIWEFRVPEDGTYRLLVRDGYSAVKSDPRLCYVLSIRKPQPDFRLVAVADGSNGSLMLRKGGRDVIHVIAGRQDGFAGEITVTATGLPEGMTAEPIVIGPDNSFGTIVLTAAADAKPV